MPTATFGGKQGEKVRLEVDPNLVAVRTRSRRSFRSGPVAGPEAAALQGMDLVLDFPEAGVEVYRRPNRKARSVAQVKEALAPAPDTRFVGRVLVDADSGDPVLYTENLFVKFRDGVEEEAARRVLLDAGLTVKDELGYAINAFFVAAPEGTGQEVFEIAEQLLEPRRRRVRPPRAGPAARSTRYLAQQWHLAKTTIGGQVDQRQRERRRRACSSPRASRSRSRSSTTASTSTTTSSPAPARSSPRATSATSDDDPRPMPGDHHGTACAGRRLRRRQSSAPPGSPPRRG